MKKGTIILAIVILVGLGIYIATTQKPNPGSKEQATSETNWNSYQNKEYGFELQYPQNWIVDTTNGIELYEEGTKQSYKWPRLIVTPATTGDYNLTHEQYKQAPNTKIFAKQNDENGFNVIRIDLDPTSQQKSFYLNCYLFQETENINVCNRIASSLKKQNPLSELKEQATKNISNNQTQQESGEWAIYTDTEIGISFEHPKELSVIKNRFSESGVPDHYKNAKSYSKSYDGTKIEICLDDPTEGGQHCEETIIAETSDFRRYAVPTRSISHEVMDCKIFSPLPCNISPIKGGQKIIRYGAVLGSPEDTIDYYTTKKVAVINRPEHSFPYVYLSKTIAGSFKEFTCAPKDIICPDTAYTEEYKGWAAEQLALGAFPSDEQLRIFNRIAESIMPID